MKKRPTYQTITRAKSAPVGIDWLMIRAAKEAVRQQKDPRRQVKGNSQVDKSER